MSVFGILEKRSTLANPSAWLQNVFGGGGPTESGTSVNMSSALTYTTLYACIQVISEAMAALPLNLYRKTDGEDGGGHELVTNLHGLNALSGMAGLLNASGRGPNEEMGAAGFKSVVMGWVLTWGNGYAEIERNNAGIPIALHPLAPNRIVPQRRRGDWRVEYQVTRTALQSPYNLEQQTVDPHGPPIDRDDMLHFGGLGFDGIMGYSPVAMAREAIGLGLSAQAYGARFFGNSGVPSGILTTEKIIKDPAKLRKAWLAANGGAGQRGTAVLEEGVKWQSIAIPANDSQFLETRQFQRSEICAIFRVPPHLVGDLDRATNNNIEHQGMDFVTYCLMGWLVRWEQECNRKLLTPEQIKAGYYYAFDVDELLRGDMTGRYAAYATARQWGYLNADDVRRKEKMNPIPGGAGKIYLVPMNMVPAEQMLEPPAPTADPAAVPGLPPTENNGQQPPTTDNGSPAAGDAGARQKKLRANFRALLVDGATRCVKKETAAVRRAAAKPAAGGGFAAGVREFYAGHGDTLRAVMMPVATGLGDLCDIPFGTVRGAVDRLANELAKRSVTELADPKIAVDGVDNLMKSWDEKRPEEIADQVLKGLGL